MRETMFKRLNVFKIPSVSEEVGTISTFLRESDYNNNLEFNVTVSRLGFVIHISGMDSARTTLKISSGFTPSGELILSMRRIKTLLPPTNNDEEVPVTHFTSFTDFVTFT